MTTINLTSSNYDVLTTNDNIVIVGMLEDIPGGRSLNVEGWPHDIIPGGHPIIKDTDDEYKPLALNSDGDAIDATKAAKTVGVLYRSVLTELALAPIMVRGSVNENAAVYTIPDAAKTALSLIRFTSDEV